MENKNWLGDLLREKRQKQNMTQLDLAQKLGYDSVQFVSLFERGLSKVPLFVLGRLFVIFKIKVKEQNEIVMRIVKQEQLQIEAEVEQGIRIQQGG